MPATNRDVRVCMDCGIRHSEAEGLGPFFVSMQGVCDLCGAETLVFDAEDEFHRFTMPGAAAPLDQGRADDRRTALIVRTVFFGALLSPLLLSAASCAAGLAGL